VCHDRSGSGNGITKAYGLATVASLIDDRLKAQPDGQLFATITNGKNTMGAYGPSIAVEDRWAIVAYVRALQKSQSVKVELLSPELKAQLEKK
jgi:mono/diheme cytochrome c family protein